MLLLYFDKDNRWKGLVQNLCRMKILIINIMQHLDKQTYVCVSGGHSMLMISESSGIFLALVNIRV